jgi:hypothetical protein
VIITLAGAAIDINDNGQTNTLYPDGAWVQAYPKPDEVYLATARAQGYGDNPMLMCREHELGHHLIAALLGLPHSPTMWAVAHGTEDPTGPLEEAAVMAVQRFARAVGASLVDAALAHAAT